MSEGSVSREALAAIRSGAGRWNMWKARREAKLRSIKDQIGTLVTLMDLSGSDLSGMNFTGYNFIANDVSSATEIRFSEILFRNANFKKSIFRGTPLMGADLRGANLEETFLWNVDFEGADLSGADLRKAFLGGVRLGTHTKLSASDWSDAIMQDVLLLNVDLRDVIGLASVKHMGHSVVSYETLRMSAALPRGFLIGMGLSLKFIGVLAQLSTEVRPFRSAFISHPHSRSQTATEFAKRLSEALVGRGVPCYMAATDLHIGELVDLSIDKAIKECDALVVCLNKAALSRDWINREVALARQYEKTILPIRIGPIAARELEAHEVWAAIESIHIHNAIGWKRNDSVFAETVEKVLSSLRL